MPDLTTARELLVDLPAPGALARKRRPRPGPQRAWREVAAKIDQALELLEVEPEQGQERCHGLDLQGAQCGEGPFHVGGCRERRNG